MTTINMELALAHLGPEADRLAEADQATAGMAATFLAHRQFAAAFECWAGHLEKTETTRVRVHGPGPGLIAAEVGFNRAADEVRALRPESGASTSPRPLLLNSGGTGPKGATKAGDSSTAGVDGRATDSRPSPLRPRLILIAAGGAL